MIRTGIPVSSWEAEGEATISTAFRLLTENTDAEPLNGLDPNDPDLEIPA